MKTTIDIPDALMIRAKKRAVELRKPLRELVVEGLKSALEESRMPRRATEKKNVRWVLHGGGLPDDMDVSDRSAMTQWFSGKK